ncbi:peroxidase [Ranunculus cassubicifolius]
MKLTAMLWLVVLGFLASNVGATVDSLMNNYYENTCPQAEYVIAKMMRKMVRRDFRVAPRILRMHFHDCFVRGCDGSVLLNSTAANKAEKDAIPNNPSLKGYEVIDQIKETLEAQCPNTVSCADILTFAARESVHLTGWFPRYYVRGGRKDGRISKEIEALQNLPPPFANASSLIKNFASKGLSLEDMVTLSGGHSIGGAFCSSTSGRFNNFTNTGKPDPTLNKKLAASLTRQCGSPNNIVVMDTITPTTLDNKYYTGLLQNKGLFTSDATLITNKQTRREVMVNAAAPSLWGMKFVRSMIKMGEIEILTGKQGEIRRKCSLIN